MWKRFLAQPPAGGAGNANRTFAIADLPNALRELVAALVWLALMTVGLVA